MKRSGLLLVFVFIFTACATPSAPPTPTPDLPATVLALAGTMIASTLTAQPSKTPAPTQTPLPTATIQASETATPELVGTFTPDPIQSGLASPTAWSGTFSPGNTAGLDEAFLLIENNTGSKEIIVTLNGTTVLRSQPVYYSYKVTGRLVISILQARYQYIIQIPNKRIFTGTFGQMKKDKSTIRVELNKVVITGP